MSSQLDRNQEIWDTIRVLQNKLAQIEAYLSEQAEESEDEY